MAFEGKGTVLGGKSGKESPERIGRIRWEKCLEEIHKTEQKIADLQQYLKGLHAALKQEEDNEMIKSIRGMKLDSHALHDLLDRKSVV